MRLSLSAAALAAVLAAPAALAQKPAPAAAPAKDAVVAIVGPYKIHMSDLQSDLQGLPAQARQLPPNKLYQMLLSQEVDRKAVLIEAHKEHLEKTPSIQQQMKEAANVKLENAYVQQKVQGQVTEAAVKAYYDKHYANKPGPKQVQARQILVSSEAKANDIIKKLNKGADFTKLAQKYSIDPGAKNGGELGWFSKGEMVPAFSDAAFALSPGKYTEKPVHTQFGWHVIMVQAKRTAPTPKLTDVKSEIKHKLAEAAVQSTLDTARNNVNIKLFNPDGTPIKASTKK